MSAHLRHAQLLDAFADLLTYPASDPAPAARRCHSLVARREAAEVLERFLADVGRLRPQELEEAYAATFDLEPTCVPYVGHHLGTDGTQRGAFLAALADVYRRDGFTIGTPEGELPDHIAVVLRYLASTPAGESRQALLQDALVPALDKMLASLDDPKNVYRSVLQALRKEVA